ncbi:MAG: ABC transporter ATP-binding protein [Gemmatimonadetes bacterium]|nr:ABC transporter ATP-binding protein [Gemmatimonadota bacterium]
MSQRNALQLHQAAVVYDQTPVLDVPELTVAHGEVLTLLGENGSGKTTLLRLLGLLVRPARGRVLFDGEEVDFGSTQRLLQLRRRMAAVMQEPLLCRMSVRQNVSLGLRFRGVPKADAAQRVNAWLRRLNISDLADRSASTLSGGEAQRTSLARAMALNPDVLFLDEPFAALDAPTRQRLLQDFLALLAESGVTTVFATHDRGEALGLGGRVAVLVQGRIGQVGSAESVFSKPYNVEVARFVGIETLLPGKVIGRERGGTDVAFGDFHVRTEEEWTGAGEVYVAVRPDEIDLHPVGGDPSGLRVNVITGRIRKTVPAELHFRVELDCGHRVVAVLSRARFRELELGVGNEVHATFPTRAAHLLPRD